MNALTWLGGEVVILALREYLATQPDAVVACLFGSVLKRLARLGRLLDTDTN